MTQGQRLGQRRVRRRTGLVLGAGGILGAAWMTGALAVLQARLGWPAGEADLLVGTSAGSVLATALHCGCSVKDLVAHQRGSPSGVLGRLCTPDLGCGAFPPLPAARLGSPRLVARALRAPRRVHPWVVASACLPLGRAEHQALRDMVNGLLAHSEQQAATAARCPAAASAAGDDPRRETQPAWRAASGRIWVTAVDYDAGWRVVFGRRGAPAATLPDAVVASCSVPGWFRPAVIGGRRYVDGGVRSGTNADLLARAGITDAYILAPAASLVTDSPRHLSERVERYIRARMTGALLREAALLRARGIGVTVLTPGPDDLAAMGGNLMDSSRRHQVLETALQTTAAALAAQPASR